MQLDFRVLPHAKKVTTNTKTMKPILTAEEFIKGLTAEKRITLALHDLNHRRGIVELMNEFAEQFKYDYSKECKCGEESTGSTWCCNVCGLPIRSDTPTKSDHLIAKQQLAIESLNEVMSNNEKVLRTLAGLLYNIGAPMNDNILGFNDKQMQWVAKVALELKKINY